MAQRQTREQWLQSLHEDEALRRQCLAALAGMLRAKTDARYESDAPKVSGGISMYDVGEEPLQEFVAKNMGKGITLVVERYVWMTRKLQIEAVLEVCDAILKEIDTL